VVAPLLSAWPRLRDRLDAVALGDFPTPVEPLVTLEGEIGRGPLYVKRDDLSSPRYGGNKVRTLEVLFGAARARGARRILATGAFGSNHAVATVLHAPAAGLEGGAILFPQPPSWAALENLRVTLTHGNPLHVLRHWSFVPFAMWRHSTDDTVVMAPGGATPAGALGYVSAALELAEQVQQGVLEEPSHVVVGVGSTCTSAGLLVGFAHARRLGIGFRRRPVVVSVRVTPWPVTSRFRILGLARRTSALLAHLAEDPSLALDHDELSLGLCIDGRQLGPGYGQPSDAGRATLELFREHHLFELDTTYSSKAAAGFLDAARRFSPGPHLFWSTKSTVPLPLVSAEALRSAPPVARRYIERSERSLGEQGLPEISRKAPM
jgi:1-aminocyclopropane-1-carboxylate deaminase/D-cysteine desulfhydrase-like pyridoxal-dependent ACC family enzyme